MADEKLDRLPEEFQTLLTDEEKKFFEDKTREYYINTLESTVINMGNYVRSLEFEKPGKGKEAIELLYKENDINKAMYNILINAIENLDKNFTYRVSDKY